MYAYSRDLRERVLRARERGDRPAEIARRFEVSRFWVYQVRDRFEEEGRRHSLRQGGYRVSRVAHMEDTIRRWISAEADLTLAELSERLATEGVLIKIPALWHQLNKWKLSFKKPRHASEQEREGVEQVRCEWKQAQPTMDSSKRVFLDETWATRA